jgi:hypothetical protein
MNPFWWPILGGVQFYFTLEEPFKDKDECIIAIVLLLHFIPLLFSVFFLLPRCGSWKVVKDNYFISCDAFSLYIHMPFVH